MEAVLRWWGSARKCRRFAWVVASCMNAMEEMRDYSKDMKKEVQGLKGPAQGAV